MEDMVAVEHFSENIAGFLLLEKSIAVIKEINLLNCNSKLFGGGIYLS